MRPETFACRLVVDVDDDAASGRICRLRRQTNEAGAICQRISIDITPNIGTFVTYIDSIIAYLIESTNKSKAIVNNTQGTGLTIRLARLGPEKKFGPQKFHVHIFNRHCSTAKIYFCIFVLQNIKIYVSIDKKASVSGDIVPQTPYHNRNRPRSPVALGLRNLYSGPKKILSI